MPGHTVPSYARPHPDKSGQAQTDTKKRGLHDNVGPFQRYGSSIFIPFSDAHSAPYTRNYVAPLHGNRGDSVPIPLEKPPRNAE